MTIAEFVKRVKEDRQRDVIAYFFRSASVEGVIGPLPKTVERALFQGILHRLKSEFSVDVRVHGTQKGRGAPVHKFHIKGLGSRNRVLQKAAVRDIYEQLYAVGAHKRFAATP
ncbi:MAG: hypothetical protein M0R76_01950 [Proteobacteria bacterium]|nr:hypothetical protein [Pseudomonadota bacterium]